jgi:hypothetical protein
LSWLHGLKHSGPAQGLAALADTQTIAVRTGLLRSTLWAVLCSLLAASACLASIAVAAPTVEQLETGCPSGVVPSFVAGTPFATLQARLGSAMGQPLTCLLSDPGSGDAMQWTDTGLAVYRKANDFASFTNADQHWALTPKGVVQWTDGSLLPESIPAAAQTASLPVPPQSMDHCGVDLLTHAEAHLDLATGHNTSSSTSMGNAGACFETHFRACEPASMATYLVIASYRSRIVGPTPSGACQVASTFLDNPNPVWPGQEMTCDLNTQLPFVEAAQDHSHCSGPLYDLIWGARIAQ